MEPEPFATPIRDVLPVLVWGAAGLVLVFLILALVRLWGWRTQQRGGSCGGIDLESLRGQLIAGEISREEYEAVRASIAGADGTKTGAPSAGPDAEHGSDSSIETGGNATGDAEQEQEDT
jgi:hypothetical protein